ncbi:cytidine deaminase [Bengtsoniella intestinalis]|uniref:cytidine deaminase n=1 Tax=Bengtsoniella intestinalis TaxID=3073143 RepID=UPI00391F99A5
MTLDQLCLTALDMRANAYNPYSHFAVGAALECADGTVFTGCNIENAAYSPTICAERVAVVKAVSEGYTQFCRIAIASSGDDICVPCGVCRQVLSEFATDLEVICLSSDGKRKTFTLKELLPHSFGASQL